MVEDEDGDLAMSRDELESASKELFGWRIELARLASSHIERVGLQLWAGALVLSDLLLQRPHLVQGRQVVELGAGLGLVSLLAHRLAAGHVCCTDGHSEALAMSRENLLRNGAKDRVSFEQVRWEEPPGDSGIWQGEVLLAADVIYDTEAADAFARLCARLRLGEKDTPNAPKPSKTSYVWYAYTIHI